MSFREEKNWELCCCQSFLTYQGKVHTQLKSARHPRQWPNPSFHLLAQHLSFPYKHDRWCDREYPDEKDRVPRDLDDPDSSPATHTDWMRKEIKVTFSFSGMLNILAFHLIVLCMLERNVLLQLPQPITYVTEILNSMCNINYFLQ